MTNETLTPTDFSEILAGFSTAFLCSHDGPAFLHARPMQVAQVHEDCSIDFLTSYSSPKMAELARNPEVCLTLQDGKRFAVIAGRATASNERAELEAAWSEAFRPWFPDGLDSRDLALVRVEAREGESWDASGMSRLRFLIEASKAYFKGEEISDEAYEHHRMKARDTAELINA